MLLAQVEKARDLFGVVVKAERQEYVRRRRRHAPQRPQQEQRVRRLAVRPGRVAGQSADRPAHSSTQQYVRQRGGRGGGEGVSPQRRWNEIEIPNQRLPARTPDPQEKEKQRIVRYDAMIHFVDLGSPKHGLNAEQPY